MKILIGSLTYPLANGVTTSINTSVDGFRALKHELMVVAPQYSLGKVRPEHHPVASSPISRWFLSALHKKERLFGLQAVPEIHRIIKDFEPDALWLHTLTWSENIFEGIMRNSRLPKVLTYHTLVEEYGRLYAGTTGAAVMRRRSKVVANAMNAVIAPSQVIAKRLVTYGVTTPIYVVPTGIKMPPTSFTKMELAERFHFSKDAKVLLYVGRVSKEKNISLLLEMISSLLYEENTVLLLVGPGDIPETEEHAQKLGVGDRVICTGPLPKEDTQRIYGGCDVFVFASQTETQGLVIGEAMLAETPVVALYSPIQPEVYPENTAMVVKDEKQFAKSVLDIIENKVLRKKLTTTAKQFVTKNFSIELMISRQVEVFEKLI